MFFPYGHTRVPLLTEGEMMVDGRQVCKGAVTWDPQALIPIFGYNKRLGWARNLTRTGDVISGEVPSHLVKTHEFFTVYLSNLEVDLFPDDTAWLIRSGVIREILVWPKSSED